MLIIISFCASNSLNTCQPDQTAPCEDILSIPFNSLVLFLHPSLSLSPSLTSSRTTHTYTERVNALHHRLKHSDMLLATFARDQPQWWPLHVLLVVALCGGAPHGGWRPDLWGLRAVACTHCALMCCGKALLRIGHVDLGNFFTRDRALCVALCAGGWASPALLYVAVVHACLLTYTVGSSAGLAQPYSNYLGFEVRALCQPSRALRLLGGTTRFMLLVEYSIDSVPSSTLRCCTLERPSRLPRFWIALLLCDFAQYCRWVTCSCLASMAVVGVMGSLSAHGYVEGELGAEPALLSVLASVASYYFAQVRFWRYISLIICPTHTFILSRPVFSFLLKIGMFRRVNLCMTVKFIPLPHPAAVDFLLL